MSEPARLIDKQTNKPTDRQSLTPHPSIVGPGDIKGDQTGILWVGGQTTNIPLVECGQTERQTDRQSRTNDMGKSERQRESIKAAFAGP